MSCKCYSYVGVFSTQFSKSKHCYELKYKIHRCYFKLSLGLASFLLFLFGHYSTTLNLESEEIIQLFWHKASNKSHLLPSMQFSHRTYRLLRETWDTVGTHFKQNYLFSLTCLASFAILELVSVIAKKLVSVRCGLGTKSIEVSRVLTVILNVHMEDKRWNLILN